ncbi:MAG: lysine--tRNA ligase [Jatrophihabitantaceae bacterium]
MAAQADLLIERVDAEPEPRAIVCASGISPSGPIHLGNLREIMVPHLVADELRRRGRDCVHVLSWDDYDRLRKVPAGVSPEFASEIGKPLTEVADPCGEHANWAEHFKAPFRSALAAMGIDLREVSQSEQYRSGAYRNQVATAIGARQRIFEILDQYRTLKTEQAESDDDYFPYRAYCSVCGKDTTTVLDFEAGSDTFGYLCANCGNRESRSLADDFNGKLVWKVDWPMRWAYEKVDFEAGGVDHSSPGSSFTVGSQIVAEIFGGQPPQYLAYSFVGTQGSAKLSSSTGGTLTPSDALEVLEPQLLRWIYARRRPNQAITIAFDHEIYRLYDEWDALVRRLEQGKATEADTLGFNRSARTAAGELPHTARPLPFRTLASVLDVAGADPAQTQRILSSITPDQPLTSLAEVRPRLDLAERWLERWAEPADRTVVRTEPDRLLLDSLDEQRQQALSLLLAGLADNWSLDGLTTLLYGVPKVQLGLPMDTAPTAELKAAQRSLFALLYRLLVSSDTGPRLPTLLLAIGPDRLRQLLT